MWIISLSLVWLTINSSEGQCSNQHCHPCSTSHLLLSLVPFCYSSVTVISQLAPLCNTPTMFPPPEFKLCISLQAFMLTFPIDHHHCYCVCYDMLCLTFVLLCLFPVETCILIHRDSQG